MSRSSESWTEDEARQHVAGLARSGLPIYAYALQEGLSRRRLYYWVERLRREAEREPMEIAQNPVKFVEIAVAPPVPVAGVLELEFPSGHVLRVPGAVGIAELIRAVGLC